MTVIIDGTNGITNVNGSAAVPAETGTDTDTGLFFPAADTIAFSEGGVEALRLNSSGQIAASTDGTASVPVFTRSNDTNTGLFFPAADTVAASVGGVEGLRLTSTGLGVGTTSPSWMVSVRKDSASASTGQYPVVQVNNANASGYAGLYLNDSTALAGLETRRDTAHLGMYAGGSERARITSAGYLLVGTTAATGDARLSVNNPDNVSGDFCFVTTLGSNCNNTSSYHYIAVTGAADKFYVYGNGNVVNTNGSYGTLSDVKLKENIVNATPKLADVMRLQVRNFNLKTEPSHKQIGFVAQEFEQVFPAMVDESPDRDEEGNQLETTTKHIKTSVLVPILVKAIQEQQAIIESLTARITALEAK